MKQEKIVDGFCIDIKGKQTVDGEQNEITINTTGSYREENGVSYICYREYDEENPEESQVSSMMVEPGKVTVTYGNSDTRMIMEEGKRHLCLYDTGYGTMTLGIFTKKLQVSLEEQGGRLAIAYTIDIDSSLASDNEIDIEVRRQPSTLFDIRQ